jgi:arsenate reductase (glutaredoxin)
VFFVIFVFQVFSGAGMTIRIYHNPKCSTSRKVLDAIRVSGKEPTIIEYLKTPPSRAELVDLLEQMKIRPRDLLRKRGTPYEELGLDNPKWTDDQLIDLMIKHPILIERPIVVGRRGVRLCRPPEKLHEVL